MLLSNTFFSSMPPKVVRMSTVYVQLVKTSSMPPSYLCGHEWVVLASCMSRLKRGWCSVACSHVDAEFSRKSIAALTLARRVARFCSLARAFGGLSTSLPRTSTIMKGRSVMLALFSQVRVCGLRAHGPHICDRFDADYDREPTTMFCMRSLLRNYYFWPHLH